MIYGNTHNSAPQKTLLVILETAILALALWLLNFGGLGSVSRWFHVAWDAAVPARRILLSAGFVIVYLRMKLTMLYLLKRSMGWEEALSVPFAFGIYYLGFSLLAGPVAVPVGAAAYIGIALFIIGSFFNTGSELLRDRWKKDPANKGRLYTGGLFRYSMHINYFGDILWVGGLALMTANFWSAIIPVMLFIFFAFGNAPVLDKHLAEKYGEEFEEYRKRTRKIIPFIY